MAKMPSFPCMPAPAATFFYKKKRGKRERRVRVKVAVSLFAPAILATAAERQEEEEESFLPFFLVGNGRVALVASERAIKKILQGQRRVCKKNAPLNKRLSFRPHLWSSQ